MDGKQLTLECDPTDKIADLKAKVLDSNIPPQRQYIVFQGKRLEDGKMLLNYKIESGNTVYLAHPLRPNPG